MEPRLTFYKSRPDSLTAIQGDALDTNNAALENFTELAGRVLPALLFSLSGLSKLGAYSAIAAYMSALRVPVALLPAVIATEVRGSLAISIAGGFLLLVANGAGPLSVDRHFAK